jgi:hypothetical protein
LPGARSFLNCGRGELVGVRDARGRAGQAELARGGFRRSVPLSGCPRVPVSW